MKRVSHSPMGSTEKLQISHKIDWKLQRSDKSIRKALNIFEYHEDSTETISNLKQDKEVSGDFADIASAESTKAIELRTRDRERKLINKIDEALKRIEDNTYGYCEVTGKPIGLKRLEARPIATLSIEAQQMHENQEQLNND